jgi:hypothetical protein
MALGNVALWFKFNISLFPSAYFLHQMKDGRLNQMKD